MNPDASDRNALRIALAREKHEYARLSLSFALLRTGERQNLKAFERALRQCERNSCHYALELLQWLPAEQTAWVSEELVVEVLMNLDLWDDVRTAAADLLVVLDSHAHITPKSLDSLLSLVSDKRAGSKRAVQRVGELRLDAARFRELHQSHPKIRIALIEGQAGVAEEADLPFFKQQYGNGFFFTGKSEDHTRAVLEAVASIPGRKARRLLLRWFKRAGDAAGRQSTIALLLAKRGDLPSEEVKELSQKVGGRAGALLEVLAGDPVPDAAIKRLRREPTDALVLAVLHELRPTASPDYLEPLIGYADSNAATRAVEVRTAAMRGLLLHEIWQQAEPSP